MLIQHSRFAPSRSYFARNNLIIWQVFSVSRQFIFRPNKWSKPNSRCFSYLGRDGGKQYVSLGDGCVNQATIIHQFMHVAGFFHEQSRTDRDTYVRIVMENVLDNFSNSYFFFDSFSTSLITDFGEPYDYRESIRKFMVMLTLNLRWSSLKDCF